MLASFLDSVKPCEAFLTMGEGVFSARDGRATAPRHRRSGCRAGVSFGVHLIVPWACPVHTRSSVVPERRKKVNGGFGVAEEAFAFFRIAR